jgi:hypothetical protein
MTLSISNLYNSLRLYRTASILHSCDRDVYRHF